MLQLSQMFVGVTLNLCALWMVRTTPSCHFRYDLFYMAVVMYTSYAILFINFFYQRYIKKSLPRQHVSGTTPTKPLLNGTPTSNGSLAHGRREEN